MRLGLCAWLVCLASVGAQTPGAASFVVYEKGKPVGTVETTVERTGDGWRIRGRSRIAGSVPVTIPNLDLSYTRDWSGRFMTVEMKAPDDAIVHVAVVGETTRTDIVRSTEARFRSSSVSPDTIFIPDRAYGAYEAVAARLAAGVPGRNLPIFIPPVGETRMIVDDVVDEDVKTTKAVVRTRRYFLTELRQRPTPVELWVVAGRLVRLDLPRQSLSIVRSDIVAP
jgi:hypothetical protein